jgi:hypothetical protein
MPGHGSGGMRMVLFVPSKLTKGIGWIQKRKKLLNLKKTKKERRRWLKSQFSGFSLSSLSIARLFAGHFWYTLETKNMNNNSQATTSSNTIATSNKQEEGTSYAATHTGHHSNSSANGRQANSNKTVRKQPLTVIILVIT